VIGSWSGHLGQPPGWSPEFVCVVEHQHQPTPPGQLAQRPRHPHPGRASGGGEVRGQRQLGRRSGSNAGFSAGIHQRCRTRGGGGGYSIAAAVLPIPPIPVAACRTVGPWGAASPHAWRAVRCDCRPADPGMRAGAPRAADPRTSQRGPVPSPSRNTNRGMLAAGQIRAPARCGTAAAGRGATREPFRRTLVLPRLDSLSQVFFEGLPIHLVCVFGRHLAPQPRLCVGNPAGYIYAIGVFRSVAKHG